MYQHNSLSVQYPLKQNAYSMKISSIFWRSFLQQFKLCLHVAIFSPFLLPPVYVVRGKVIFILGNVCLFTIAGGRGGYPIPGLAGVGGTPSQVRGGRPHPRSRWRGGEGLSRLEMGYLPYLDLGRGTPPPRPEMGYPPHYTEQHSEHLLCGGWCASCVHAGGLFLLIKLITQRFVSHNGFQTHSVRFSHRHHRLNANRKTLRY